jgi:hypothetical protein
MKATHLSGIISRVIPISSAALAATFFPWFFPPLRIIIVTWAWVIELFLLSTPIQSGGTAPRSSNWDGIVQ